MKALYRFLSFCTVATLLLPACHKKDTNSTADQGPYFAKVKTIIQNNCLSCHSSSGSWSGRPTKFDTDADIVAAYASIKAAVADPATLTNKRMPEGGSLSTADVNTVINWYNKGGKATD